MRKSLILPTIIALLVFPLTLLFDWYYYDSGWYAGDIDQIRGYTEIDLTTVLFMLGICFFAKYFLYDWYCRRRVKRSHSRIGLMVFTFFYLFALYIDIFAIFASAKPVTDAGFASLAIIFYSPPILFVGAALVWASSPIPRKSKF